MLRTVRMMLLLVVLSIPLAGCVTTGTGGSDPAVCAQWRGVSWSSKDTPQTIADVKGNNARRAAWCG